MIVFNGNDIEITRGDTLVMEIPFEGAGLDENTIAVMTVKKKPDKDTEALFEQAVNLSEGLTALFYMSSADTDLKPKTYYWDVRLFIPHEGEEDEVRTPMDYASFTVTASVGDANK